jgi:hypothetical protein
MPAVDISAVALATLWALSEFASTGLVTLMREEYGADRGVLPEDLVAAAATGVDGDTRAGADIIIWGVGGIGVAPRPAGAE